MTSLSNAILIQDDEESSTTEPGSSRIRTRARPNYSYRESETMSQESIDDDVDTTPSRKRKRYETDGDFDFKKYFKDVGKGLAHGIQQLKDQNQALRDELLQEKEEHRKTQEVLSQEREKRICECKICYQQPDQWVMLSCGHMFCKPCTKRVRRQIPKRCPNCRAPIRGCFDCLPFAG